MINPALRGVFYVWELPQKSPHEEGSHRYAQNVASL